MDVQGRPDPGKLGSRASTELARGAHPTAQGSLCPFCDIGGLETQIRQGLRSGLQTCAKEPSERLSCATSHSVPFLARPTQHPAAPGDIHTGPMLAEDFQLVAFSYSPSQLSRCDANRGLWAFLCTTFEQWCPHRGVRGIDCV